MGLTLYEIGMIIYRPGFEETPSELEQIVEKADYMCEYMMSGKIKLINPHSKHQE